MTMIPHTAMILAAGKGMRMRPLTLEKPKPLLEVGGKPMLDHVLDACVAAGVARGVINSYYKGAMIEAHVAARQDMAITLSREDELLDTGGGVKRALPHLGTDPIFVINSDLPWQDGPVPALQRLAKAFDPTKMDALLLLMPLGQARGFKNAAGDFFMDADGRLRRFGTQPPRPYVFVAVQIIKPELYLSVAAKIFSNNLLWDEAESKGRLYGLVHDGACFHIGTPQDFNEANQLLADGKGWFL